MDIQIIRNFKKGGKEDYLSFLKSFKDYKIKDLFMDMYIQYELLRNPKHYFAVQSEKKKIILKIKKQLKTDEPYVLGTWVVIPRKKQIYHILNQGDYLDYRTIRNRNLITLEEQNVLYNKKIIFIGMSVGSQVLMSFVRTGIGNNFILVDADTVEGHNMNRTNYNINDIGNKKVSVALDNILSVDPYIKVKAIDEYLNDTNIKGLIKDADLIVDSFDNFEVKIKLRKMAKKFNKPVLSGFDVSMGAMVIVERYDIDEDLDLDFYLNGFSEREIIASKGKGIEETTNTFIKIIGEEYHDKRMLDSVYSVGKTLTGYPQTAVATNLAASLWTISAADLLLGKIRKSLREYVNLEDVIRGTYSGKVSVHANRI